MTLEFASIPLAWLAGMLSILSPCVWPLVPVVMSSAATAGASGPWMLGAGLSVSFALAGTVLTFVLLNAGIDTELVRYLSAVLLLLVAATLLLPALSQKVTSGLSGLVGGVHAIGPTAAGAPVAQFGVGALLGLVWLPCVGPTLGAAIGLASLGQSMGMAFVVMLTFGLGTASMLLFAAAASRNLLGRWRGRLLEGSGHGRRMLGWMLLLLGVLVLSGVDKVLETYALEMLPDWALML